MDQQRTRTPYLVVMSYMAIANVVMAVLVLIMSILLQGASVFSASTFTGEAVLGLNMLHWIFIIRHRISKDATLAKWSLIFIVFVLSAGLGSALREMVTCYFADTSSYESIAECANIWTEGHISSFVDPAGSVCNGKVVSDELLGGCSAAQVSKNYISHARVLGVLIAIAMWSQWLLSICIIVLYVFFAEEKMLRNAKMESMLTTMGLVYMAVLSGKTNEFVETGVSIDRFSEELLREYEKTVLAKFPTLKS